GIQRAQSLERVGLQQRKMRIPRRGRESARRASEVRLYGTRDGGPAALPTHWKLVSATALLIALALLALTVAHWAWQWFGPAPVAIATATPDNDDARQLADAHLFGTAATAAAPGAVAAATSLGDLRLLGIIVERDGRGYALFRAPARGPLL